MTEKSGGFELPKDFSKPIKAKLPENNATIGRFHLLPFTESDSIDSESLPSALVEFLAQTIKKQR